MELVSVLIPAHNAEKTIDRCMESIVNQTYSNLDIILVENGSSDETLNKCVEWKSKDARISIYKSKKGVSNARNKAMNSMRGGMQYLLMRMTGLNMMQ